MLTKQAMKKLSYIKEYTYLSYYSMGMSEVILNKVLRKKIVRISAV
jgi:hypothetical protein